MKKIIYGLVAVLSFAFIGNVNAASARINISPASRTMLVGNTITITVTTSSSTSLGAVNYTVAYDSNMLSLVSTNSPTGGARTVAYFTSKGNTSVSYTYTFKARSSGNTTISIIGAEAGDDNANSLSVSTGSCKIKIMTQKELEATYSSDNYLSGLSVEGYEFDKPFNRDELEYSVTLNPETESININASKEDGTATINGAGTINVSEGVNNLKVEVVAQNGNIRTYTINATVAEYDPITVVVNNEKYTVVRSKKIQTFNNNLFTESTVLISEYEVPAYYNEITNTTLVALKDKDGNIGYYIYNNGEYTPFSELKLNNIDLMVKEGPTLKNYELKTIAIGDNTYKAYINADSRFALLYGTNIMNNNTGYYVYDSYENTLQRYDVEFASIIQNNSDTLLYIVCGLSGLSLVLLMLLIASNLKKSNKPKKEKIKKKGNTPTEAMNNMMNEHLDAIEKSLELEKNKKK